MAVRLCRQHTPMPEPEIVRGDLLDQRVEVIVNAWNRNFIPRRAVAALPPGAKPGSAMPRRLALPI